MFEVPLSDVILLIAAVCLIDKYLACCLNSKHDTHYVCLSITIQNVSSLPVLVGIRWYFNTMFFLCCLSKWSLWRQLWCHIVYILPPPALQHVVYALMVLN